jgi:YidC/Oxa1 family membrane protein insertase
MLYLANIFQPLIDVFEAILKAIHSVIGGSWGWSIVLLTIFVRALLLPLAVKQYHSMQKLQLMAPQLKAIQNRYKDDKQRQQQEVMKFYRENNVNPFASCLPLVAQIPVFIGLFYMLRQSLRKDICPQVQLQYHLATHAPIGHTVPCGDNHGAQFLFIPDLTNRATGAVLIVLIVLYVATQLASTLLMSAPTMDQTQRRLMLLLPLFFVIFIISFPAGVIVYWITTNAWTMGQQYVIRRRLGVVTPPPVAAPAGAAAAQPGGSGAAAPNGAASGGLAGLFRGRSQPADGGEAKADKQPAAVSAPAKARRDAPPPRPPRKKKKRSGRRR